MVNSYICSLCIVVFFRIFILDYWTHIIWGIFSHSGDSSFVCGAANEDVGYDNNEACKSEMQRRAHNQQMDDEIRRAEAQGHYRKAGSFERQKY